jgi:hypothetical protein
MSANPKKSIETPSLVVRPISVGAVNWIGISTLYVKEVMRFLKVPVQTLFGPAMTATLFMMVFAVAVGERISLGNFDNFIQFLAPWLNHDGRFTKCLCQHLILSNKCQGAG